MLPPIRRGHVFAGDLATVQLWFSGSTWPLYNVREQNDKYVSPILVGHTAYAGTGICFAVEN